MVFIYDQLEQNPPPPNRYVISDGQQRFSIDSYNSTWCETHRARFQQHYQKLQQFMQKRNMTFIPLATHEVVADVLRMRPAKSNYHE